MTGTHFIRESLFVLSGLLIWAAHFTVVYVFNALACARHFAEAQVFGLGILPAAIGAITLIALGSIAAVLVTARLRRSFDQELARDPRISGFMRYLMFAVAGLAALSIVWTGLPVLFIPPCG